MIFGKTYTVKEVKVPDGYIATVTGTSPNFTIVNKHTPETINISGTKTWDDYGLESLRPEKIVIKLFANGKLNETKEVTAADGWKWTFKNKPVYENKKEIKYTITEDPVPGNYDSTITGDAENGFVVTNTLKKAAAKVTKTVTGNSGEYDKEFTFEARVLASEAATSPIDVTGITAKKYNSENKLVDGAVITVKNGVMSFTLKHGEKIEISNLPVGTYLQVKETNASGYTTMINASTVSNNTYETIGQLSSTSVISANVTNNKEATIDTGLFVNNMPYILALVVVAFGAVVLVIRRKRF